MVPPRHEEDGSGPERSSSSTNPQRNSIASQSSYTPSLSDIPVADGFRHNTNAFDSTSSSSSTATPQNGRHFFDQSYNQTPSESSATMRNRPSSVAKPHRPHESLTLRHEHNTSRNSPPSFPRASIASSEGPVMRPDSPYRGPTGPSHPYQMYPQRTLSNATTETTTPLPRESPAAAQRQQGPTHPYTLYTQSTAEVEEPRASAPSIPVGFNNLPDNYRRQLGPDGEEAGDLIGPLGHTEELPPYTRYPEIAYVRKGSSNDTDSISAPSSSASGVPAVAAGAGGLGRATRDPEFSSTEEDLALHRSHPSIRSQHSQVSRHDINTAAREITEKPSRQEMWQRRAKKKLWGIVPYWAICLVMVGMVLMGIIMGAVIGTVLKKSDDQTRKAMAQSEFPPKTPVVEVIPYVTVPDDLDPITTGFYGLPSLDKDEAPRKCFNNSLEFNAWSCDIPSPIYNINITEIKNGSKLERYNLELEANNAKTASFLWGTQPPIVQNVTVLKLVNDTFDMGRGPAWWLSTTYKKTVIVPEALFPLPERRRKRWEDDYDFDPLMREKSGPKGAQEGEKPWICTWPHTTLEIFIYPNVNASLAGSDKDNPTEPVYTVQTSDPDSKAPKRFYPKVVKFLERRLSGDLSSTAVCRQVEVLAGGLDSRPVLDDDKKPIKIEIIETTSAWEEQMVADQKREVVREWYGKPSIHNGLTRRDAQELTSCGCLWWST